MTQPVRLAIVGGSGVATPELIDVLAHSDTRPPMHITLIGRSAEKLQQVTRVSQRLAETASVALTVFAQTSLQEGLEGADYVLNQVRVGGYEARAYDETFPHQFNLPGDENTGPGGMNCAIRTIPVVLDLCRAMEQVSPHAVLINLTNPGALIQYMVSKYSSISVIGVCELPVVLAEMASHVLGKPVRDLETDYWGMTHNGWMTSVKMNGKQMIGEVIEHIEQAPDLAIDPAVIRAIGALPSPYLKYQFHGDRILAWQRQGKVRAEELLRMESEMLEAYQGEISDKPESLKARHAVWYEQIVIPTILAHATDSRQRLVVNITNNGVLPFLSDDTVVEVPCQVGRNGCIPDTYDNSLPREVVAHLQANAAYEMLWAEAVVEKSSEKALRAALVNPLITSYDQAKGILDTIWTPYIANSATNLAHI